METAFCQLRDIEIPFGASNVPQVRHEAAYKATNEEPVHRKRRRKRNKWKQTTNVSLLNELRPNCRTLSITSAMDLVYYLSVRGTVCQIRGE